MIFGAIPPPRNFAKIRTRGGRGLQPVQPKDSIPPWGAHRSAVGAARAVCAGVKRAAAHWRRCASAGAARAVFAGAARARRSAGRRGGRFRGAGNRSLPSGRRREAGRGRAWLHEAHKGRAAGAAARGGTWPGGAARAVCGVFRGRRGEGAAGGGAGKTAAPSAACVGFQATSAIEAAGGRKSPFLPYKEALFSGRGSCQIRAVLRPNPCRFGRVAFSAARSDECVTPGGAGEKPRRKTKRPSERSAPHEKPDFRYRD